MGRDALDGLLDATQMRVDELLDLATPLTADRTSPLRLKNRDSAAGLNGLMRLLVRLRMREPDELSLSVLDARLHCLAPDHHWIPG